MNRILCITLRFLDPVPQFHGRTNEGEPEWPPSPLRLFQGMVASATRRWTPEQLNDTILPALKWLETVIPSIVTPPVKPDSIGFRMYVPNNSGDLMTAAWARGDTDTDMSKFRVEKDVRPLHLLDNTLHFLFPVSPQGQSHFEAIQSIARSMTHFGWGIDQIAGDARLISEADAASLPGEVWTPDSGSHGSPLRVPIPGTYDALDLRHERFLNRIGPNGFVPVPPISVFRVVRYRRAAEPGIRPFVAFKILEPDASGVKAFDPLRHTREVVGMLRHAVAEMARQQGWPPDQINSFIHGKVADGSGPLSGQGIPDRFQYLALPTFNAKLKRFESIRRVLIVAPPHCSKEIAWATRMMAGAELFNHQGPAGLLTILPRSDSVLRSYIEPETTWSTVTPVILPGYDDPDHLRRKLRDVRDAQTQQRLLKRLEARVESLIRKAFRQAGYSDELMKRAEFVWRTVGYQAGVESASRYLPPQNLDAAPRYHVKVRFPFAVPGPIAIGSGRFRGFGLFANMKEA
ncbi:type I-G CRISPR-associated protein Csb2 [Schlesneria sp.]|uniref:type I-G CRISPR-associated protein Csb2 n=1 Tax=Schlesneria sp. TaxID=2762018 RepID=UPI002EDBC373